MFRQWQEWILNKIMATTSYIFFGLMLIPLIAFLVWMFKQDKNRNYIGISLLVIAMVATAYTIIKLDQTFMKEKAPAAPKASSFR